MKESDEGAIECPPRVGAEAALAHHLLPHVRAIPHRGEAFLGDRYQGGKQRQQCEWPTIIPTMMFASPFFYPVHFPKGTAAMLRIRQLGDPVLRKRAAEVANAYIPLPICV